MTKGFTAADVPDLSGRVILVTGANTGVGFEADPHKASRLWDPSIEMTGVDPRI